MKALPLHERDDWRAEAEEEIWVMQTEKEENISII